MQIANNSGFHSYGEKERATFSGPQDLNTRPETSGFADLEITKAVWKHRYLSLALFTLSCALGLWQLVYASKPSYYAEATIYVSPSYVRIPSTDREQLQIAYSTLLNQQMLILGKYETLVLSLRNMEGAGLVWRKAGEDEQSAVNRLRKQIDIHRIPDSYEVALGVSATSKELSAKMANIIAKTFLERGVSQDSGDRAKRLALLERERRQVEVALSQKLENAATISKELQISDLAKSVPPDDELLSSTREAFDAARRKRMESEVELHMVEGVPTGNITPELRAAAERALDSDAGLTSSLIGLRQRRAEIEARTQGLLSDHPLKRQAAQEMATIDAQIATIKGDALQQASSRLLQKLRSQLERDHQVELGLAAEVKQRESRVGAVSEAVLRSAGVQSEIERLRTQLNAIQQRISDLTLESAAPPLLQLFSAAEVPTEPSKSALKKSLIFVLGISFVLALGIPICLNALDRRIHRPEQVERITGFPATGLSVGVGSIAAAYTDSEFQRFVNRVERGFHKNSIRTFLLTSVAGLPESRRVGGELANALAGRGFQVLLIDLGDEHASEVRTDRETAWPVLPKADTLEALLMKVVQDRGPHQAALLTPRFIPAAQRPGIGSAVVSALTRFRQEYKFVIINAAPLLRSPETELVASAVDMNLVLVEAERASITDLKRSVTLLKRIGATGIGMVVASVPVDEASKLHSSAREHNSSAAIA